MGCGLNMPSPDLLTPNRAAAAVWTWAPGHPFNFSSDGEPAIQRGVPARPLRAWRAQADAGSCAVLSAADARWRTALCTAAARPSACRLRNASISALGGGWLLDASLPRGMCPPGAQFDLPRHPRENYLLAAALQRAGHEAAWLPLHGPEWSTDGWPAEQQVRQPTSMHHILLHLALPATAAMVASAALVAVSVTVRGQVSAWRGRSQQLYQALGQA